MEPLNKDAVRVIRHVADSTTKRYADFVSADDLYQELYLYWSGNEKKFERWRTGSDEFRLMRALFGKAKQYCEREKAQKSGYEFEDLFWYDPTLLAGLMPMVLNSKWDGLSGEVDEGQPRGKTVASEGGSLLAMVADIRRVLRPQHRAWDWDIDSDAGRLNLEWLSRRLGGPFPAAPGYLPGHLAGRKKKQEEEAA